MCAWPIAVISCALPALRCASRSPRIARASGQLPRSAATQRAGEAVELGQQPALPGGIEARLLDELAQRLEVPRHLPRLGVEQREAGAVQARRLPRRAQRAVVGRLLPRAAGPVAAARERVGQAHQVVAGHLQLELHAAGRRAERGGDALVAAAPHEPLHGRAVAVEQRLAAAVPDAARPAARPSARGPWRRAGTSTSPTAGRTSRRSPPAGTRAPAPPRRGCARSARSRAARRGRPPPGGSSERRRLAVCAMRARVCAGRRLTIAPQPMPPRPRGARPARPARLRGGARG